MKKSIVLFYCTVLMCNVLFPIIPQEEPKKNSQAADPLNKNASAEPLFTFAPYNDNRHSIHINNHDAEYQCVGQYGEPLILCMTCLSKEDLKKNFKKLNARSARFYLVNINVLLYKDFLNNFSEEEWGEYYRSLKPHEQTIMPATLKEQYDLIAQTYKEAADEGTSFRQWWYGMPLEYGTQEWWEQVKRNNACYAEQKEAIHTAHLKLKLVLFKFTR